MRKFFKSVLVFLLIACVLSFAACAQREISSMYVNDDGQLIIEYTDGTSSNLGVLENNSVQRAVNKALLSSVSIFCDNSAGSGVIYELDKKDGNAYIITNYHVIYDAEEGISTEIFVCIYGQEYYEYFIPATYVGGSLTYDIAILQISNSDVLMQSDCVAVTVGDSNAVTPGLTAIAVGNAEGKGLSATLGIVNVDSEQLKMKGADDITPVEYRVMRIDTPVNSGNSGGGLFDGKGNLIGIVNAKIKDSSIENIGYAITSSVAINVVKNILYNINTQKVQKCLLGVTVTGSPSKAVYDEISKKTIIVESVTVVETAAGSLSYGKFLKDDIVLSATVGEYSMDFTRSFHIVDFMLLVNNGDTVTFTVRRGGVETEVVITIPANHATEID